ncbi:signal peptidase II [Austwickia chelonae]|nr:signal peptidase II [Austwickia chelonae]SEW25225.1 signal peptidase II [Austwickia chelonae]
MPGGRSAGRGNSAAGWTPLVLGLAVLVYAADQLTKMWALTHLEPGNRREWLGELVQLHLIFNSGAAFSLGSNITWVFTIIQAVVPAVILFFTPRLKTWQWATGAGLALGGALGNLTDRLLRSPGFGIGHVVDFLELPNWPIFNVADSAIVGAALIVTLATAMGVEAFGEETGAAAPTTRQGDDIADKKDPAEGNSGTFGDKNRG